jgi:DNA primase
LGGAAAAGEEEYDERLKRALRKRRLPESFLSMLKSLGVDDLDDLMEYLDDDIIEKMDLPPVQAKKLRSVKEDALAGTSRVQQQASAEGLLKKLFEEDRGVSAALEVQCCSSFVNRH